MNFQTDEFLIFRLPIQLFFSFHPLSIEYFSRLMNFMTSCWASLQLHGGTSKEILIQFGLTGKRKKARMKIIVQKIDYFLQLRVCRCCTTNTWNIFFDLWEFRQGSCSLRFYSRRQWKISQKKKDVKAKWREENSMSEMLKSIKKIKENGKCDSLGGRETWKEL